MNTRVVVLCTDVLIDNLSVGISVFHRSENWALYVIGHRQQSPKAALWEDTNGSLIFRQLHTFGGRDNRTACHAVVADKIDISYNTDEGPRIPLAGWAEEQCSCKPRLYENRAYMGIQAVYNMAAPTAIR